MRSSPQRANAFVRCRLWTPISVDRHSPVHSPSVLGAARWPPGAGGQKRGAALAQGWRDVTSVSRAVFCGLILLYSGGASRAAESVSPPNNGGEYLARAADCVACHSTPGGKAFAGGLKMGTPLGAIYSTNITPDPETGIGRYSLTDFDRAVRQGIAKDGHRLYPAMPYSSYVKLTDADVAALYGFFMKLVPPVRQANLKSEIPVLLSIRWPLAIWNVFFVPNRSYVAKPNRDDAWNRGAYLVQGLGHCGACHTPRGIGLEEKALDDSSPNYLAGAGL